MFHLRFTTFLNRGITSNRMEMDGMPQSNGHPTLHIDATVWLYRNGNGLHPYLSAAAIFLRKIHRQDLGYNLMIVRDDVSICLLFPQPPVMDLLMHTLCFSVESACAFYSCKATLLATLPLVSHHNWLVDGDGTSALWACTGGTTPAPGTKKHGHGTWRKYGHGNHWQNIYKW